MTRYQLETCVRLKGLGWTSPAPDLTNPTVNIQIGGPVEIIPPGETEVWLVRSEGSVIPKKFSFED